MGENSGSEKMRDYALCSLQHCPDRTLVHSIITAKHRVRSAQAGRQRVWDRELMAGGRLARTFLPSHSLFHGLSCHNQGKELLDKNGTKGEGTGYFMKGHVLLIGKMGNRPRFNTNVLLSKATLPAPIKCFRRGRSQDLGLSLSHWASKKPG